MVLYEVDIHRNVWNEEVNMQAVYTALEQAGIQLDKEERRANIHGLDRTDDQPEYVYVDASQVGQAVQIINDLGYETDEDE